MGIKQFLYKWLIYRRVYYSEYIYEEKSTLFDSIFDLPTLKFDTDKFLRSDKGQKMLEQVKKIPIEK